MNSHPSHRHGLDGKATPQTPEKIVMCQLTPNHSTARPAPSGPSPVAAGFTLVEMLVAMAVTLIMMVALGRAFGFVGSNVRDGRASTQIANELRDATTRLSDELDLTTTTLRVAEPGFEPQGYFMYYEGPVTDSTSSIFRASTNNDGSVNLSDSRIGDFDDYVAFTAVARGDNWFTGKVPRYLLDLRAGSPLPTDPSGFLAASNFDPVVIRSKYAEIIYFASPDYLSSVPPSDVGYPAYADADGDVDLTIAIPGAVENGLPDRIRLHRRVLLIRPDLNINGILPQQTMLGGLTFMQPDTWPSATLRSTGLNSATLPDINSAVADDGWLYGMAAIHQQCDLSVRRVFNNQGLPAQAVAANSLEDLTQPHNRFAHVRVPNSVLTGRPMINDLNEPTSMPVLALSNSATVLRTQTSDPATTVRIAPPEAPATAPVVTPVALSGFIRPEFVLGNDVVHTDIPGDTWGLERRGEDVLLGQILAFDAQVFDPSAAFVDTSRFLTNQTGVIVGPSDAGYRDAMGAFVTQRNQTTLGGNQLPLGAFGDEGGFVDLCYSVLAGGSLRGWQARRNDRRQTTDSGAISQATTLSALVSPFSGIVGYGTVNPLPQDVYQPSFFGSGKVVVRNNAIRLFQPTFDTFTNSYETDGFTQADVSSGTGTVWSNASNSGNADQGADGLDNDQSFGVDDFAEREVTPPFTTTNAQSVRITIRVENAGTRQVEQFSVVHAD